MAEKRENHGCNGGTSGLFSHSFSGPAAASGSPAQRVESQTWRGGSAEPPRREPKAGRLASQSHSGSRRRHTRAGRSWRGGSDPRRAKAGRPADASGSLRDGAKRIAPPAWWPGSARRTGDATQPPGERRRMAGQASGRLSPAASAWKKPRPRSLAFAWAAFLSRGRWVGAGNLTPRRQIIRWPPRARLRPDGLGRCGTRRQRRTARRSPFRGRRSPAFSPSRTS